MSDTNKARFGSLAELLAWCQRAPASVHLTATELAEILELLVGAEPVVPVKAPESWRVRLWEVHEDVRLSVHEVCEALGRGKSWVYARAKDSNDMERLPARRLAGELTFRVGDLRRWIRRHEEDARDAA